MKKLGYSAMALMASASMAMAGPCDDPFANQDACVAVPEISALQGTAAIAAIAAVVLLAWERSRRAA